MEHSNVVDAQLNTLGSNSAQGTSSSPIDRILNSRALSHLYEFGVLSDVKILDDEAGPDEFDHGSRFGAWGVGLFQSDHDYQLIDQFDRRLGLVELQAASAAQQQKHQSSQNATQKHEIERRDLKRDVQAVCITGSQKVYISKARLLNGRAHKRDLEIFHGKKSHHLSIYGRLCSDIAAVRDHLDAGALHNLFTAYMDEWRNKPIHDTHLDGYNRQDYKLLFLNTCAMSLGCEIPADHIRLMKKHLANVGFKRDAVLQLGTLLDAGYKSGEPYDFGSRGLNDTLLAGGPPRNHKYFPGSRIINVEWPGGITTEMMHNNIVDAEIAKVFFKDKCKFNRPEDFIDFFAKICRDTNPRPDGFGSKIENDNECKACSAIVGKDGGRLLICAKCRTTKYCGKECQKKHWKKHKMVCKAPPSASP